MKILGACIIIGSHLAAWYFHKGLNGSIDPAWVYAWGSLAGIVGMGFLASN